MKTNYAAVLLLSFLFLKNELRSQNIGINSSGAAADASALLDVDATNKGLLIPRVALTITTSNAPIGAGVATSLLVYNTATVNDVTPGFYYWNGSWVRLNTGSGSGWGLSGNALTGGTSATPNEFIGTTNNYDWVLKTNNTEKVRVTAAGYVGIGTSISAPTTLLHLASSGSSTIMRYENPNVVTSIIPVTNYTTAVTYAGVTVDTITGVGVVAWGTPGSATTNNGVYATAANMTSTGSITPSHYLKARGFGFAIPLTATILGIRVEWEKKVAASTNANAIDNSIMIVKGGVISGSDYKRSPTDWGTANNVYASYGTGTTDLWGVAWTPADINGIDFGAVLSVKNANATLRTFSVDACRITVYYSMPAVNIYGNVDWSTGTDFSDFGKFKISNASTLSSNNYIAIAGTGEVGIGTSSPDPSALLDVTSTTKGMLMPRVALTGTGSALPTTSPVTSLIVYNTASVSDVVPGHYYWNGTKWVQLGNGWSLLGNAGTVDGTNFLGTTDNIPFNFRVNNVTAGRIAPADLNVSLGYQSLLTGTGYGCVAIGHEALKANDRSDDSQGFGWGNVAVGYESMRVTTTGGWNTGCGNGTIRSNLSGLFNAAFGNIALSSTTASRNTGMGSASLVNNTTGTQNSALGGGYQDFFWPNTVYGTGDRVTTGYNNTFLGYLSNVSVGGGAFTNATAVGALAQVGASNCLVLGSINGVNTATVSTNVGIGCTTPQYPLHVVGNVGVVGTIYATAASVSAGVLACSDLRYKSNISTLSNSLDKVLALRGVNYFWKTNDFPDKKFSSDKQVGFIAQELEQIFPEVVFTDKDGFKSVDYSRLTPLLVEAIKEQEKMIQVQREQNLSMKKDLDDLRVSTSQELDKLRAQLDGLTKRGPADYSPALSPVIAPPKKGRLPSKTSESGLPGPEQIQENGMSPPPPPR